jgi:hypothetical protein
VLLRLFVGFDFGVSLILLGGLPGADGPSKTVTLYLERSITLLGLAGGLLETTRFPCLTSTSTSGRSISLISVAMSLLHTDTRLRNGVPLALRSKNVPCDLATCTPSIFHHILFNPLTLIPMSSSTTLVFPACLVFLTSRKNPPALMSWRLSRIISYYMYRIIPRIIPRIILYTIS